MKNILLLFIVASCIFLQAQEVQEKEMVDSLAGTISHSHSNLGIEAKFTIKKIDYQNLIIDLNSSIKTTVSQIEESFSLDLNEVVDTYQIPSQDGGVTIIVNLKSKVLITKKNTEYQNLFHDEVVSEDLREDSDIWFNFTNESDAQQFEKMLIKVKR